MPAAVLVLDGEDSVVDLLLVVVLPADLAQLPATSAEDQITLLEIARPKP